LPFWQALKAQPTPDTIEATPRDRLGSRHFSLTVDTALKTLKKAAKQNATLADSINTHSAALQLLDSLPEAQDILTFVGEISSLLLSYIQLVLLGKQLDPFTPIYGKSITILSTTWEMLSNKYSKNTVKRKSHNGNTKGADSDSDNDTDVGTKRVKLNTTESALRKNQAKQRFESSIAELYIPLAKDMIRNLPKLPSSYNWADLLVWMIRVSEQITAIYMDKDKSATNTSLWTQIASFIFSETPDEYRPQDNTTSYMGRPFDLFDNIIKRYRKA
jgi:hypothetical protein